VFRGISLSLATKCQLLFGLSVILLLTAALSVVALRMQALVDRAPRLRAADFADAWLDDRLQIRRGDEPTVTRLPDVPVREPLVVSVIDQSGFTAAAASDPVLADTIARFETDAEATEDFTPTTGPDGRTVYRYVRAIRQSEVLDFSPDVAVQGFGDPVAQLLVVQLRDEDARAQRTLNIIYTIAAGLFAGLLAIAAFWFITTRIILQPVRVLRGYAEKVSEGDLNIRSEIHTGDEFQQLSEMFNLMLESWKSTADKLRKANKSLDLRVGELAESNVALYEANKVKGEFLANVSHELRTPLNSIVGFAEVLRETLPGPGEQGGDDPTIQKRRRYCENIIISGRQLLELITDLLDLAKIEAGRMDLHLAPASVEDTVESLLALMTPQAQKAGVTLDAAVPPRLPVLHTDAGRLQQVLFNFVSNAIKFTPAGGSVRVQVDAGTLPDVDDGPERQAVRFAVVDTGPGIAADDQERIFEKFVQLDAGETRQRGGTGLGLTIARELAALLQGQIEVESNPGKGATFSITVPLKPSPKKAPLMPEVAGE